MLTCEIPASGGLGTKALVFEEDSLQRILYEANPVKTKHIITECFLTCLPCYMLNIKPIRYENQSKKQ